MPNARLSSDLRPSPDALLHAAQREGRGRLKVFLGAAPGVGKTYEMLQEAAAKKREGVDVAIGIVETHGRQETQALVHGLEIVPRRVVDYKEHRLEEMDLDAILRRRPALVLVDELAHTNAEGSRHPKRYMDVEELLVAGINVFTTMNVQHVESLNDVVAQITRIRVRETVPDAILERADDIEVIDITPQDLIQRLNEGKVYVPQTAQRAVAHYFSPGNLTALRELALRRTAQRVDAQLLNHMQANAIPGPWAAGERILVCIDDAIGSEALVRYARRMTERLQAPWTALHVETAVSLRRSDAANDRITETLRLAERLGGEAVTIPGRDVASEAVRYAATHNATHIIIGKPAKSRWQEMIQGSVAHEIIRQAGDISVHVIALGGEKEQARRRRVLPAHAERDPRSYLASTAFVLGALALGLVLDRFMDVQNIALVFLTAILGASVTFGLWPGLYASVLSVLAFNFFFLPPVQTFTIADPENVFAFFFFLLVALIASNLTARVRSQAIVARQRAKTTDDLYLFSRKLSTVGSLDDLLWATSFQIASMLKVRVVVLMPEHGRLELKSGYPPEDLLDEADLGAAKWAFEHDRETGRGSDTLPGAKRLFIPMRTSRGAVGVIGIDRDKPGVLLTPEQRRLFHALADQAAQAAERMRLVEDVDRARLAAESDRLRTALLTSISHDLKTPLAAIIGAAGTLKGYSADLDEDSKEALLATVQDEADRLNRFIANLLDMTRLESGAIAPNIALNDLSDVLGAALQRARKVLSNDYVELHLAPNLPMVAVDPVLFEQVLFNLLDNAAKYSPLQATVLIQAWEEVGSIVLQVLDEGDGIPEEDVERIFDKFYRARKGDRVRAGTGLGLPICRGFIEAMGGTIVAMNRTDRRGAVFTVRLPVPDQGQLEQEVA
ncbi:sensor histidine kinase KdpD [Microvirga sp. CF3016]|uniref:sensor histidine kinase KdpD n=1 Tax=Microvirga sp. CF3016 TaxID=3110181 RepID=UPI002E77E259|nr:sensor histidine kinase KdpD [Microvirga sp. CF3016]MEE1613670.1 sensor histidine kinase KdpD [Microvirga sp. CF3016]